jgi:hypothetical protein
LLTGAALGISFIIPNILVKFTAGSSVGKFSAN